MGRSNLTCLTIVLLFVCVRLRSSSAATPQTPVPANYQSLLRNNKAKRWKKKSSCVGKYRVSYLRVCNVQRERFAPRCLRCNRSVAEKLKVLATWKVINKVEETTYELSENTISCCNYIRIGRGIFLSEWNQYLFQLIILKGQFQ